ncbi:prolipoprotein diacylglyceryl transferase [Hyphococcus sp.]|uniref:prolipoprotein diacylglyceryl transferase n=1 Tax=Hyphococcus sp. TaxID=2038636 RepID=UPI00207DFF80|nr:MAG: prolipoprotein diacylglyceryl transferase [Marinicaulis sp.]
MSIPYPHIEPVLFKIGPFSLRWYSLAYIGGLAVAWWYLTRLIKKTALWPKAGPPLTRVLLDDVVFWVAIGVMAGGRLGYLLFYEPNLIIAPWEKLFGVVPFPPALMTWNGGMSFHGGLLGVTLVGVLFARKHKLNMLSLGDMFACVTPFGLFFGRLANFINAELYGRPWDGPWAMVFPTDPLGLPRHPSQLYEAALEGVVLFAILFVATRVYGFLKRPGATMGLFLAGYAVSRIIVENFRQPDDIATLPQFPFGLTMGMVLSIPMLLLGLWLIWRTRSAPAKAAA